MMTEQEQEQLVTEWQNSPEKFFKDHWPDIFLWPKLYEILDALKNNRRVVVPSGHGVGKTWLMARIALWFLFSYAGAKVITTAPTWGQVENLLWSEIRKAYTDSKIPLGGRILNTEIKIAEDWFAVGFSTSGVASEREFGTPKFQGYHSENLLVLLDEAAGVKPEIWVSVDALVVGENNKVLAIANPTSPTGHFYEACKSPLWQKVQISCFDHPNIVENKVLVQGAVTREWIEERRIEWGIDSPLWKAKILGDFPDEGSDTLIPLSWLEACVGLDLPIEGAKRLGIDVARFGGDMTVLTTILGQVVQAQEAVNKKDTNWTVGRVIVLNKQDNFDYIGVDDTGVGGGVTDSLQDSGIDVDAMNFGSKAIEDDKFENLKAEIYWNLRQAIRDKLIELPNSRPLINQLASIKYGYTRQGRIKIESKDDMKKRGLKSPDLADSLAIAYSAGREQTQPEITVVSVATGDFDD